MELTSPPSGDGRWTTEPPKDISSPKPLKRPPPLSLSLPPLLSLRPFSLISISEIAAAPPPSLSARPPLLFDVLNGEPREHRPTVTKTTTVVKSKSIRNFEVRRGVDRADICSIALSANVQWLVVSSDKGTIHVYSLRVRVVGEDAAADATVRTPTLLCQNSSTSLDALISPSTGGNPGSSLSFMKGVLPKYFSSEWSFAQFHLPECTQYIAAFGSQNTIVTAGTDGSFYRCSFDPVNGGEMVQQEYVRFLKTESRPR